jgi:hypothetical protein
MGSAFKKEFDVNSSASHEPIQTSFNACKICSCYNYKYNAEKTISANGEASNVKIVAKGVFHLSTLFISHLVST